MTRVRRWQLPVGILVALLATQAFPHWGTQISAQYGSDVGSYEQIARAAPGLPRVDLPRQHAERFPAHWLAGVVARGTNLPVHDVYRAATALALLALLGLLAIALSRMELAPSSKVLCLALVAASPYPFRYLLAAPGMLSDAVFLVGLAVLLLGFVEDRPLVVCGGLAVATLGRQTAVPVAVAAGVLLLLRRGGRARIAWAVAAVGVSTAIFAVEAIVSRRFSQPGGASTLDMTVLGAPGGARALVVHLGRSALPLLVPAAVVAGAWFRTRRRPPLAPSLIACAVVAQALVLSPGWVAKNEPRLAGLALPALALVAAGALRHVEVTRVRAAWVAIALVVASLHPRYSDVAVPGTSVWLGLMLLACAAIVAALAWPGRPTTHGPRPDAVQPAQPAGISSASTAR